jgi:hypothetical protein
LPSVPGSVKEGAFQPKSQTGVSSAIAQSSSQICHGVALISTAPPDKASLAYG